MPFSTMCSAASALPDRQRRRACDVCGLSNLEPDLLAVLAQHCFYERVLIAGDEENRCASRQSEGLIVWQSQFYASIPYGPHGFGTGRDGLLIVLGGCCGLDPSGFYPILATGNPQCLLIPLV